MLECQADGEVGVRGIIKSMKSLTRVDNSLLLKPLRVKMNVPMVVRVAVMIETTANEARNN